MGKLHQTLFVFLFLVYLDGFPIFFIAFNTRSWRRIMVGGRWISKFGTIFEKYPLKIFTIFRLIRLSHFQLTLFLRLLTFYQLHMVSLLLLLLFFFVVFFLSGNSFTVFQNCLLSVTRLTSRLLNISFLVFRSDLTDISLFSIRYI